MSESRYTRLGSGGRQGDGGKLGISGPSGGQIAPHERQALDLERAERARGGGFERFTERDVVTRLADAPERDVRRERAALRRKIEGDERPIDAFRESSELRRSRSSRPQYPRPGRARKGAEPADVHSEGRNRGRAFQRRGNLREAGLVDTTEELDRDVQVLDGDPRDARGVRPEPVDFPREALPDLVGQQDRDERPDVGYRTVSFTTVAWRSFRRRRSRAIWVDCHLTADRSPEN